MALRNADSLLVKDNQERLAGLTPGSTPPYEDAKAYSPDIQDEVAPQVQEETQIEETQSLETTPESDNKPETIEQPTELKQQAQPKEAPKVSQNVDEYGNEVKPARTYTEEEVQSMIRDRLSRGAYAQAQQPAPQYAPPAQQYAAPIQQQTQDFQYDPTSADNWEKQLEDFIDRRIETREQTQARQVQEHREAQIQAQFQDKFSSGMTKYHDFHQVVGNKPITDSMMLATRGMTDPAAFIYAASKNHGEELARIAQIPDPFQQGAEIGKLEERMRKAKNITSANKPVSKVSSDMGSKQEHKPSIDQRIIEHSRQRSRRV